MSESSEYSPAPLQPTSPPPTTNTEYNPIFEKLVIEPTDGQVLGVIAYGAYKKAKWEWAQEVFKKNGRQRTDAELKAYIATWTPSQLENVRNNAAQVLSSYADTVIDAARAGIVTEALRGTFWKSVWTSVFAAAVYTVILIILAFILSKAGVDFLGIFQHTATTTPPPGG